MDALRLADLIPEDQILADLQARTKDSALQEISEMLGVRLGNGMQGSILEALRQRERLASTGIGEQVAIPHGKLDELPQVVGALARSREGIDFGAIDGRLTHLFFVIVAPGSANGAHLKALARIARCCKSEEFRARLINAQRPAEMHEILQREDA